MHRVVPCVLLGLGFAGPAAAEPSATLSAADRAAVFKAAGFKARGDQYVRCEEDPPTASSQPGAIETADLNHDGRPEAFVTESSLFCYGNTAAAFVLVTQDANGTWRKILDEVGVHVVRKTEHQGWADVEVGGPGMGKQPVFQWNGSKYVKAGR